MTINTNNQRKIDFFTRLYEEARIEASAIYDEMEKYIEQYKGSNEIDGSIERAKVVRNITYELIETQISSQIPLPEVESIIYSDDNERNAKSIENLLKNKRKELFYEKINDLDERFTLIYGSSVFFIEWDNSITTHNTVGDIKITVLKPSQFTPQPNIYEVQDMEYCFVDFESTTDEISRLYGVKEMDTGAENDPKTTKIHLCFYRNEDGKVCKYAWSGDTELEDTNDYYSRKIVICKNCSEPKGLCSCKKPEYFTTSAEYEYTGSDIRLTNGKFIPATKNGELTKIPYYKMELLPIVIRKNTSEEMSLFGQSDCKFIRHQQQTINKIESRILEKLIKGGVYPIVPQDFQGEIGNDIFGKVIRATSGDRALFGTLDLQVEIDRDIRQSDRIYEHAKKILGITDTLQGYVDKSATSAIAKQIQIKQGEGRMKSKRIMKNAAYAEIDKIIFCYYLAYADECRPVSYKDAFGKVQNLQFNKYDFLVLDEFGQYYYNDRYTFSTNVTEELTSNKEFYIEENRLNFEKGAYGDITKIETQLLFWQNMELLKYPFAHENVQRLRQLAQEKA